MGQAAFKNNNNKVTRCSTFRIRQRLEKANKEASGPESQSQEEAERHLRQEPRSLVQESQLGKRRAGRGQGSELTRTPHARQGCEFAAVITHSSELSLLMLWPPLAACSPGSKPHGETWQPQPNRLLIVQPAGLSLGLGRCGSRGVVSNKRALVTSIPGTSVASMTQNI